jgi:hypothetical protein
VLTGRPDDNTYCEPTAGADGFDVISSINTKKKSGKNFRTFLVTWRNVFALIPGELPSPFHSKSINRNLKYMGAKILSSGETDIMEFPKQWTNRIIMIGRLSSSILCAQSAALSSLAVHLW